MFKPQMKFAKITSLVFLLFSAVVFLYAVGYMTDLYPLYLAQAYGKVKGNMLFQEMQPFNKTLVLVSIAVVLASLLPFIFSTNKRRLYYKDNFISSLVQAGVYVGCSILIIVGNIKYKTKFLTTVDLEALAAEAEKRGWFYSGTTIMFDIGFVIAALLLVNVALIIFNLKWKQKIMLEEQAILKGEVKDVKE